MPRTSSPIWLWLAAAFCLAGHAYLAFGLGLSVDEAHYALYAAHPALSYFDHPPLVGWLQMPFVWLGGSDWLLRIVPLGLWVLTAWVLWRWSGKWSLWALALFLLSPIHQLLGLALVPDTLLLPLTLWVMVLTWKLSNFSLDDSASWWLWLWLGVALGLSGLAKYTGVFLALSCAAVLLAAHGWALWKARGLWVAALVAALMISPVLIWNAQNGWISFTYQLGHAGGNQSWQWTNVLRFDLVQLLSYGTLPLLGLIVFLMRLQTQHKRLMWLCLAFGLPTLLLATYSSGKGSALPHWTATGWLALLPLSALGLQHLWRGAGVSSAIRQAARVLVCGLGLLQATSIAALGLMMATGGQWQGRSLLGNTGNPFADLHGWQAASQAAQQLHESHKTDAMLVSNWTLASRLAWYARPARVLTLDSKNKQFELWHGKIQAGDSVIWVNWSQMPFNVPVADSLFESCQPLPKINPLDSSLPSLSSFYFYLCHNWQGKT
jgi:4-amino-4-deoxy-L-arabinose transferase-like glycosyltransferase